jgi:hypothetical protein
MRRKDTGEKLDKISLPNMRGKTQNSFVPTLPRGRYNTKEKMILLSV